MRRQFAFLLCLSAGLLRAGGPPETKAKWSDLAPLVNGRKVAMTLPAGTHIEGKVASVEPEGLRMRVSKTSDRRAVPKGETIVPRASVSVLQITEYNKKGRILCSLGAMGAGGAIVAAQNIDVYEGAALIAVPAVEAAGIAGLGVAGYFIGKRIDRHITYIRVDTGN